MTRSSANPPFPGAHSQVPGAHSLEAPDGSPPVLARPGTLPLERAVEHTGEGWRIRLPVRAEEVTVSKRAVVCERVTVRREAVPGVAHAQTVVRRERLRVDLEGPLEVVRPDARADGGDA